ncbi:hypothetical protein FGO68_gene13419 [Halteria grandinella]|uniref:Uncharacterized protein n=1 Tax=Halteria grandinella TaxID=5974 RepID=A0A8J8NV84_HALGN|nr:hypothetical protein FGO68_gene13419 [Halteria grandinella]
MKPGEGLQQTFNFIIKYMNQEEGLEHSEEEETIFKEKHLIISLVKRVSDQPREADDVIKENAEDFNRLGNLIPNTTKKILNDVALLKNSNSIDIMINLREQKPALVKDLDQYYELKFDKKWENAMLDQIIVSSGIGQVSRAISIFDLTQIAENNGQNEEQRVQTEVTQGDLADSIRGLASNPSPIPGEAESLPQNSLLHQYLPLEGFTNCDNLSPHMTYRLSDYELVAEVEKPMQQFKMKYVIILKYVGKRQDAQGISQMLQSKYNISKETLIIGTTDKKKYAYWRAVFLKQYKVSF